ncbi:MAG: SpoIIE family protein phosphatase [Desulfuromonadales bacterium]|nr:SpoIIE family protein phosphatase [Desulfuromonadales bacterium]
MASFLVILSSGEQRLVSSLKPSLVIGRRSDCDISVIDPLVSRQHAKVYQAEDRCQIQDMGSRNGTMVNGEHISQPRELYPGDTITVGASRVVFEPAGIIRSLQDRDAPEPVLSEHITMQSSPGQMMAPAEFLEAVADIANGIARNKPLDGLLDSVLRLCVDRMSAERAGVLLFDEQGEFVPRAYLAKSASIEPFIISKTIARKAMQENRALLIRDVAGEESINTSESVIGLRIRSAICVPLWNGEKTIGVLYLDTTEPNHQFTDMDLHFFSTLSGMIAEKLENVTLTDIAREKQRLDEELVVANEIQSHLFPATIPSIEGYDLAAYNRPCTEIGGDYFDVIATGDSYGIVIADVVGKGIGPAILMSNLQAMVRSLSNEAGNPAQLFKRINADLNGRIGDSRFITCCYLVLSPEQGTIYYSNAGHNPPLLYRRFGDIETFEASGIPLGIFAETEYDSSAINIDCGDVLLLYTDGVTECANKAGELFGEARLKTVLERSSLADAQGIREAVCSAMDDFRSGFSHADDVTIVVVKRRAVNP